MAYFISTRVDKLHQQLEYLKKEVELIILEDPCILENNSVMVDVNYEKDGEVFLFSDYAIDMETLLRHNLLEFAFGLAEGFDNRADDMNDSISEHANQEGEGRRKLLH